MHFPLEDFEAVRKTSKGKLKQYEVKLKQYE